MREPTPEQDALLSARVEALVAENTWPAPELFEAEMQPDLTPEQRAHIATFGVPVDSFNPGTYWIACFDEVSHMPTDAEIRVLRSYIEYVLTHQYTAEHRDTVLVRPGLPRSSGHNTHIFRKGIRWDKALHFNEGWAYRRASWRQGPQYVPERSEPNWRPLSLVEAIDRMHTYDGKLGGQGVRWEWTKWKVEHASVFAKDVNAR